MCGHMLSYTLGQCSEQMLTEPEKYDQCFLWIRVTTRPGFCKGGILTVSQAHNQRATDSPPASLDGRVTSVQTAEHIPSRTPALIVHRNVNTR